MSGATGLTLEAWVNPSSLRNNADIGRNVIADFCVSGSTSMVMMYIRENGIVRFGGRSQSLDGFQSVVTASTEVSTGKWFHLAGVLDFTNKTIRFYVNGELVASQNSVAFGSNTYSSGAGSDEIIGANQPLTATQYYHGYIDDMRIWKTPRSQSQIIDNMTETISSQANLLGYWKFDDSANDSSGSGYNGTLVGDVAYSSTSFAFGKHCRTSSSGNWRDISKWQVSPDNSNWGDAAVYPIAGTTAYIRSNHDIDLDANTRCQNIVLSGGSINVGSYSLTVSGTLTQNSGSITGGTPSVDGFVSPNVQYVSITQNSTPITGFSASTSIGANWPTRINRQWTVNGSFAGSKFVTFYWDAADDNSYNWVGLNKVPAVYLGGNELNQTAYDVASNPRFVTVNVTSFDAKGDFYVGAANDETLPVELSSFTAVFTVSKSVNLRWVSQSETNLMGYYLYRGITENLYNAQMVSPLIGGTNTSAQHVYEYSDGEIYSSGTYYYWLQSMDYDGTYSFHGPISVFVDMEGSGGTPDIPMTMRLQSVYPNPFSAYTFIRYELDKATDVKISIYNTRGQVVRTFNEGTRVPAIHKLEWDGKNASGSLCPSGIYLIRMQADGKESYIKAIITK